jgi:hypothetical protein
VPKVIKVAHKQSAFILIYFNVGYPNFAKMKNKISSYIHLLIYDPQNLFRISVIKVQHLLKPEVFFDFLHFKPYRSYKKSFIKVLFCSNKVLNSPSLSLIILLFIIMINITESFGLKIACRGDKCSRASRNRIKNFHHK